MNKLRIVSVMALIFAFGGIANADTLNVDGAGAAFSDGRQMRGMTTARVESEYGRRLLCVVETVGLAATATRLLGRRARNLGERISERCRSSRGMS